MTSYDPHAILKKRRDVKVLQKENCRGVESEKSKAGVISQKEINRKYYLSNRKRIMAAVKAYKESHRKEIKRASVRYYLENKEKIRLYKLQYQSKNRDALRAKKAVYYTKNRETIKARTRKNYFKNPESIKSAARRWTARNLERVRAFASAYCKRNPDKMRLAAQKRRARIKTVSTPSQIRMADTKIKKLLSKESAGCKYCTGRFKTRKMHIEHIIPISRGGKHSPENVCLACEPCNRSKTSKIPFKEWIPPKLRNINQ